MNILFLSILTFVTFFACGKTTAEDKKNSPLPQSGSTEIPRWEAVDREDLSFDYYVTHAESGLQMSELGAGVLSMAPDLMLKGPEGEAMRFVMMLEVVTAESCQQDIRGSGSSWVGLIPEHTPPDLVLFFEEKTRAMETNKQFSILSFIVLNAEKDRCARLTFYDTYLKGYDHKLSIFDHSEMSKAILDIVKSTRLK